jgi:ubiquitin C-terminal hydrolase
MGVCENPDIKQIGNGEANIEKPKEKIESKNENEKINIENQNNKIENKIEKMGVDFKNEQSEAKIEKIEVKDINKKEQNIPESTKVERANDDKKVEIIKQYITKEIIPRGLNNIGSTCYMNSVLQNLYHVYDLSNELLKLYTKNEESREKLEKLPMTSALLEVITELSYGKENSMSPHKFKKIIGKDELFRYFEANDSKTLTLYVLDNLNKELNENKIITENENLISKIRTYKEKDAENIVKLFNENYNSLIGDLFNGLKLTNYVCLKCKNCVKNYQIFNIITFNIEKTFSLKYNKNSMKKMNNLKVDIFDCFQLEIKTNQFNGDNQLFCEKCNKSNDGESNNKFIIAPKIMIVNLDRGMSNRFMCDVKFPVELDINRYLEIKGKNYQLIGTIEHLGPSGQSGHFIANCKHFDGKWYIFSDSSVYLIGNEYKKNGIPYLVFYEREN